MILRGRSGAAPIWMCRGEEPALEPGVSSPDGRVRDLRARLDHPLFRGAAHVVGLDGVSLVHGRHAATRPVAVCGDDDGPQLVVHVGLRGHPTARAEGVQGLLSHRLPGADVLYTPSTRTTEAEAAFRRLRERSDTILFGRVNYLGYEAYWPK